MKAWELLRLGVVSLAEKFGGVDVSDEVFAAMKDHVAEALAPFVARVANEARVRFSPPRRLRDGDDHCRRAPQPAALRRRAVDGLWLGQAEATKAIARLRAMSYAERAANACIGHERADLVLAGCAILEAIRVAFPSRAAQDRRPGSARAS